MLSAIIPEEVALPFNFDVVLILIFSAYLVYGYISGGHKQIRLSINLILPFVIIYYMGPMITNYLYVPLSNTLFFELVSEYLSFGKNTVTMIIAYLSTYIVVFTGIFILSIYARRYLLNENMRAKLGKKNNYLGALFSLINGYVLVYFIILPAFSINLVSVNSYLTNFVLEHPPPFSRIARTAEKAVPIKGLADKADAFQQLLSQEGIEDYYNEAITEYQQQYMGGANSYEKDFMNLVYSDLTEEAKNALDTAYFEMFDESLSLTNYYGVSYILVTETDTNTYLYQDLLDYENQFNEIFDANQEIVDVYEASVENYEELLANYEYTQAYELYLDELDVYLDALEAYETLKVDALLSGTAFTQEFTETRPEMSLDEPSNYVPYEGTVAPIDPELEPSDEVVAAQEYVDDYANKEDIRSDLTSLGSNFENHAGLLKWYVEGLSNGDNTPPNMNNISAVIVSFKANYDDIMAGVSDDALEEKLYLAQMSIRSYDVFTLWLECTMENIDTVELDDIALESSRCPAFNTALVVDYDFADEAFSIVGTLFEGESVSWIISQFKYDYEAGLFDEPFEGFPEVQDILESTKGLVDEYEEYYKDIASSIQGDIPMILKIGISVMKYHLDVYETLETTPLIAAVFNDAARFCGNPQYVQGYDVQICTQNSSEGGLFGDFMNVRYLVGEIYFKAYFMVDEENNPKVYDSDKMHAFLAEVNASVENNVITQESVSAIADQFAFNVVDETNGTTLLEQMYADGQITIEAMRILGEDEYGLFSDDFRLKVKSLIR
ncbi:CvpA family protein [Candidatus Xianfuyuplasma coldseepsis]|uniref:CvpA family protein n=1 Tax=Candidatus Xianfuyuplasma coldseepsis TaxID=2782163 RepID=A0A7L7KR41_9MOLU|nr:CvpA family protein [Xianfuyuplasma coldseepsis]QMS84889.1 CvpA family protein [Xianfuyuplasma coldseepsis]